MRPSEARLSAPFLYLVFYITSFALLMLILRKLPLPGVPVFLSLLLAYLLNPLVGFLNRRWRWSRRRAAWVLVGALVLTLFGISVLVFPYLQAQTAKAARQLPVFMDTLSREIQPVMRFLEQLSDRPLGQIDLSAALQSAFFRGWNHYRTSLAEVGTSLWSMLHVLFYILFIPLFTAFLLINFSRMHRSLFSWVPNRYRPAFMRKTKTLNLILSAYIRGQALVALVLCVLYALGLHLIGFPFPVLVGLLTGLGDFVPYVGTLVGLGAALIISLSQKAGLEPVLLVMAVFASIKVLENWVLYPRIVGPRVGLPFYAVILAIMIWGQLLGFWGLLSAIPFTAGLKAFWSDFFQEYRCSRFYRKP